MRHSLKRMTSACLCVLLAAMMWLGCVSAVYAEDASAKEAEAEIQEAEAAVEEETAEVVEEIDTSEAEDGEVVTEEAPAEGSSEGTQEPVDPQKALEQYLTTFVQNITTTLAGMEEDQIEELKSSSDSFTAAAVSTWDVNRKELGALKEEQPENAVTVEASEDGTVYTVTQKAAFEEAEADFIYTISAADGTPQDLVINVDLPMSVNMKRAALNTLMGLGTVFVMLIFLSLVISLFKLIPDGSKKKEEPAPVPVVRAAEPAPVVYEDETDDQELVAVIAAAIAAAEGTTPDGFVVRSIRKAGRSRR